MAFKKNLRGADTYAMPSTPKYRDNYDRIFGKKKEPNPCFACDGKGYFLKLNEDAAEPCLACHPQSVDPIAQVQDEDCD